MSALQELREQVEREERQAEARRNAAALARMEQAKEELVKAVGQDLLDELQAEYRESTVGGLEVRFTYRNKWSRWYNVVRSVMAKEIAGWTATVDAQVEEWERERESKRQKLLDAFAPHKGYNYTLTDARAKMDHAMGYVERYDLGADAELAPLLAAYREWVQAREVEKAQQDQAEAERKAQERAARKAEVLEALANATAHDHLLELREDISQYWGGWEGEFARDEDVRTAYDMAIVRIAALVEEREERRTAAERQAFHPFCYYRVWYGIVATGEDGAYADQECFETLTPTPDKAGWWTPAIQKRHPMQMAHVVKIERIAVEDASAMPGWCPWEDTEHGRIRVPPPDAERL